MNFVRELIERTRELCLPYARGVNVYEWNSQNNRWIQGITMNGFKRQWMCKLILSLTHWLVSLLFPSAKCALLARYCSAFECWTSLGVLLTICLSLLLSYTSRIEPFNRTCNGLRSNYVKNFRWKDGRAEKSQIITKHW